MGLKFQSAWSTGPVLIKASGRRSRMPVSWPSGVRRTIPSRDLSGARTDPGGDGTSGDRKEGLDIFRQAGFAPAPPGSLLTTSPEMQLEGNDRLPHSPDLTIQMFVYLREMKMNMTAGARCLIRYGATKSRGFS